MPSPSAALSPSEAWEDLLHGPIVEPEVLLDEDAGEELRLTVPAWREPARPVGHDPLRHRQSQPRQHKEAVVQRQPTARSRSRTSLSTEQRDLSRSSVPEGFHRFQTGGTHGRIGARQQADRAADQRAPGRAPPGPAPASKPGRRRQPTTMMTPRLAPRMPPMTPIEALSNRNCAAMCPRVAPMARRRPISPVRSITDTSVMLAMPIAPTTSDRPPSKQEHDVHVALHFIAHALRLLRDFDFQDPWIIGPQRRPAFARRSGTPRRSWSRRPPCRDRPTRNPGARCLRG